MGIKFYVAHNLNFHISDCHTLQLGKQKKANSVIVENNPLKEQKNLRKAWFECCSHKTKMNAKAKKVKSVFRCDFMLSRSQCYR